MTKLYSCIEFSIENKANVIHFVLADRHSTSIRELGQKTLGHIDEQPVLSAALGNTLFWY